MKKRLRTPGAPRIPAPGTKPWENAMRRELREAARDGSNWKVTLFPACHEPEEGFGRLTEQLNNAKQILLELFDETEMKEAA